ncbi:MAG TPA: ABC transporter transmembrane domain-containing protein [Bosea sp. (in: a-proteobacteria)]|uniref:ABC transporter transmembrane domain-containing protein n=1 Tax=Bosea sp. (in: a-proteobacteria) TaxID=1871050 RepID=UPI002E0F104A|nr:ABC transporter transmembrane domain-containing protein [Bosea sp. (in: a-proteobacteria)]
MLLVLTCASFPLLYVALTLPKLILNGAIEGRATPLDAYLPEMSQLSLLWLLSGLLLALIVANGAIKMRLNIYRGVLGERLIRRLRFVMIERTLGMAPDRSERISQGEAVAMITAESEPLTGVMGDAFAQPVFQIGQMLTILAFLFAQNIWLGVAGVSLIPLQAYLIPRMQREVNSLHRQRVGEMRSLSEAIGENVAGAASLRVHGGRRYRLAQFSDRLQRLFAVRVRIFRRKFLIKFVNNLLTQITPFLFYALGGYLVIHGQLSIGALVAAIAAARDIADPWRELLTYWNAAQEAASRYAHLLARFLSGPPARNTAPSKLDVEPLPRFNADILFANVSLVARDGTAILHQVDLTVPGGSLVAVEARDDVVRRAITDLLTGERKPDSGTIAIGGRDIDAIPSDVLATRIGLATSTPFLFRASVADNIRMPLRRLPLPGEDSTLSERLIEAERTGNSTDRLDIAWNDGGVSGFGDGATIDQWSLQIFDAIGASDLLLDRALDVRLAHYHHRSLHEDLAACRDLVAERLAADGLAGEVEPFTPDGFNASLSLGENLLFAVRQRDIDCGRYRAVLCELGDLALSRPLLRFACELTPVLARAFGEVGPSHPLLRRLTSIGPEQFQRLTELALRIEPNRLDTLTQQDRVTLLELVFQVTARDLGSAVPAHLTQTIVECRAAARASLGDLTARGFEAIVPGRYHASLTVLENLLGGTVRSRSLAWQRKLRRVVMDVLAERGLDGALRLLIEEVDAGPGGENLSVASREHVAVTRALIRRPDVLILDHALASAGASDRKHMWSRIRKLLPDATMLVIEPEFASQDGFDHVIRIRDGRLDAKLVPAVADARTATLLTGQEDKVAALGKVIEFRGLRRAQLELLAYASDWQTYSAGDYAFRAGEPTDGVYVVTEGRGELRYPEADYTHDEALDDVWAGRMIGDLSVILDRERMSSLVAITDMTCLKIGEQEFRDIYESDLGVALTLLRTISGHLHLAVHELDLATRR